jgi:hypothetical protein
MHFMRALATVFRPTLQCHISFLYLQLQLRLYSSKFQPNDKLVATMRLRVLIPCYLHGGNANF